MMCCALIRRRPHTHSSIEYKMSLCRSNESNGETTDEYKIAALVLPKHNFDCVLCVVIILKCTKCCNSKKQAYQPFLCIIHVDQTWHGWHYHRQKYMLMTIRVSR